jgi:hypothetical protein
MAERRCTHKCGDWRCGSYQFNLYKHDIDQGDLCDVHYWQTRAQKAEATSKELTAEDWVILRCLREMHQNKIMMGQTGAKALNFLVAKVGRKTVIDMLDQLEPEDI